MDGSVITTGLTAAKGVVEALKVTIETSKAMGKIELQGQLLDVQSKMMDLLLKHQEVIDDNFELKRQLRETTEKLSQKSVVEVHFNTYWNRNDRGKLSGPFSQYFFDLEGKQVRLKAMFLSRFTGGQEDFVFYDEPPRSKGERPQQFHVSLKFLKENVEENEYVGALEKGR